MNNDIFFGEEDSKYIKKKSKKRIEKSTHRHDYNGYCTTSSIQKNRDSALINYCTICGKVKNIIFMVGEDNKTIKKLKKQNRVINVDDFDIKSLLDIKYIPIQ